jgi:glycosyltransferase involved in cell wall biosynthesis
LQIAETVFRQVHEIRMKTCMIAYTFYEGDTRVMRYAEALAGRGDQVDVISLRREGQSYREVVNGVNVFRIQRRSPNKGGKVSYLFGILLFFLRSMILITRSHIRSPYQIIHVHSVPDFLVFSAWLPKLMGAKVILDIHDLLPELCESKYGVKAGSLAYKLAILVERMSATFADHVIAANDIWQQRLITRAVKNGNCSVLVNFPDRGLFFRKGRTRTDQKFIIMYPGSLNWHQGLDIAIRAFAAIKDDIPEAEFHIYGEGASRSSLVQLIKELGLENRVILKGYLSTREIATAIENADLGVEPKRNNGFGNEAFSTKILEFMALGVPMIVSETMIHRYYLNDSMVKFFRGGDEGDLAESILLLNRHPELRGSLVRNASEFIEHNNWDTKKSEYLALADSLARKSRP